MRAGATATALILVAGFFLAPAILAGGDFGPLTDGHLVEAALRSELVASWRTTDQDMTAGLVHLVDYWRRYHAIKIAIATALLAVLVALATSCLRRNGAAVAAIVAAFALLAVLLVVVNIQATTAPLAARQHGLRPGVSGDTAEPRGAPVRPDSRGHDRQREQVSRRDVRRNSHACSGFHGVCGMGVEGRSPASSLGVGDDLGSDRGRADGRRGGHCPDESGRGRVAAGVLHRCRRLAPGLFHRQFVCQKLGERESAGGPVILAQQVQPLHGGQHAFGDRIA